MKLRYVLFQFRNALIYKLTVKHGRGHGIHSPFVYGLIREVMLQSKKEKHRYSWVKKMQGELFNNNSLIHVAAKGAGTRFSQQQFVRAGRLARRSGLPKKYIRLLIKLTHYLGVENVLELGACCGLTSACLARGKDPIMVHTIEGNYERYQFALKMFSEWNISNIAIENEDFSDALLKYKNNGVRFDMVFMDGDHAFTPTIQYFEQLIPLMREDAVIIIDDIYWSPEMTAAWKEIQNHPGVTVTVDLNRLGIVFLQRSQAKQHFSVRF